MTGFRIYELAMLLLGYTDENAEIIPDKATEKRTVAAINQIGSDIGNAVPITRLSQTVTTDKRTMDIMPYGVAMLLALAEGDSHQNVIFTALYNARRSAAKSQIVEISDVMPKMEGVM